MATRPPPPSGNPPAYAAAGRVFGRTDLRSVVIIFTISATVWSLVWTGGAFSDVSGDKQDDQLKKIVVFDIVLGTLYATIAAMEIFGLIAAISRRSSLVRLFVGFSWLVVLLVFGTELVRTIAHFRFKEGIINECIGEVTGLRVHSSFGFWGGVTRTISSDEAKQFCNEAWSRNSVSTIAWLIATTLLSMFFASIAHSYYRQLLDPTFARAPSDQVRLAALQSGGGAPYGGPYSGGYNPGFSSYAPAGFGAAAPPYEGTRLPGYGSEFPPKDVGDDKENPFAESHQRVGGGPSEADFTHPGARA